MSTADFLYRVAVRGAAVVLPVAARFSDKLQRGEAGRGEALASMRGWSEAARDTARPLVWLHAPSVGEALMAQAIVAELRRMEPSAQIAFTFFSPSAEQTAARVGADWHGYLPLDTVANARASLDALAPACLAFVRTEVWPTLLREARARGCRTAMVNGVLADSSSRLGAGARALLRPAYARLDAVGVVSDVDAANFPALGVDPARIVVTGDARFDQVRDRVATLDPNRPLLRPFRNAGVRWLVAGSTWPVDERFLMPALIEGRAHGWRSVIAPHEPTASHVAELERALDGAGLSHARLHTDEHPVPVNADVIVVDRVGVLADLYVIADVAYVGGGFGSAGLHSVVEPAALGVPVIYGPRHGNAHEAQRLADAGGGFIAADGASLVQVLRLLRTDTAAHAAAAAAARLFVDAHAGGAARGAALIGDLVRSD